MPGAPLLTALQERGVLVLDGGLATELEQAGADLSGGLWSARLLVEQPELIARVHRDYLAAGADLATTASYQASVAGFVRAGLTPAAAEAALQRSVRLAVDARDAFWADLDPVDQTRRVRPLVATSIGPYGAVLADGSEYRGDYAVSPAELVDFHSRRLEVLVAAGAEVLACETLPSLTEAVALVEALAGWPQLTGWVSFTARNDREVSDGTPVGVCAAYLDEQPQVLAVGVNCCPVADTTALLREAAAGTGKPLVAYPNSGETYDAGSGTWRGRPAASGHGAYAREWYAAGARLVGGCCRTRPGDIAGIATAVRGLLS